jgi:hypothetical protein
VFGAFGANQRKIDDASLMAYVGSQGDKASRRARRHARDARKPIDDTRLQIASETIAHIADRIPPRAIAGTVFPGMIRA